MKVSMGPFVTYIGPYQLAGLLRYLGFSEQYCDRLAERMLGGRLEDFCEWVHEKRNRKIYVKVEKYDSWNVDGTLAPIIVPLLKQLRNKNTGSAYVDNADVPEQLRIYSDEPNMTPAEWEIWHARWNWTLDEMIWAFTQIADHTEDNFDLSNAEDWANYREFQARITCGTTLFGKYFRSLWD